jgi:hypothetical protein
MPFRFGWRRPLFFNAQILCVNGKRTMEDATTDTLPQHVSATTLPDLYRQSDPEVERILFAWNACPPTHRQETILRRISSKFYQRGYCFARQETIAKAVGCAKSTLQLEMDILTARGFLILERRQGTSNITLLAPGVQDTLKILKLKKLQAGLSPAALIASCVRNEPSRKGCFQPTFIYDFCSSA